MPKKMLRAVLTMVALLAVLSLAGCGAEKPKDSADKAVQGWAEMYAYGVSDNESATGMTKAQSEQISEKVIGDTLKAFSMYPLSQENVEVMTTEYINKLQAAMEIKTKIKKDDSEHPVVEVSASVIDHQGAEKLAQTNEDLLALGVALGQLRAQGFTDEQLKANAEFQDAAMECISNYVDEIPLKATQTFEVKCSVAKGDDGKMYWAPEDPQALMNFITGM